jgi:hypothetical protein
MSMRATCMLTHVICSDRNSYRALEKRPGIYSVRPHEAPTPVLISDLLAVSIQL